MSRVRLIHSNAAESEAGAAKLGAAGYDVAHGPLDPASYRALMQKPPAAVVIDLSRAPAMGRDLALALRKQKTTRHVPLVFVDGEDNKVAAIRELLPDAVYTTWSRIRGALKRVIARPPADPVVPDSVFAAYAGTPLPKKLGIKAGSVVAVIGAPKGFEKTLGKLPKRATLRTGARGKCDLAILFTKTRKDLERRVDRMGKFAGKDGLWIVWPKKASGIASDLSQTVVRRIGEASGLVDYKVCKVDDTWTGLRFTRRSSRKR